MNSTVKMEVDESEMRVDTRQENLVKMGWKHEWIRTVQQYACRLCATEVNTGESRSDTFAATPPSEIRATDFELGSEL